MRVGSVSPIDHALKGVFEGDLLIKCDRRGGNGRIP
jgi:hypothetical protein